MISVLVVDDDPHLRKIAVFGLQLDEGLVVEECDSGEAALARLASQPFDVVLMDCEMPGLGGLETARRIALEHANVSIVMLSGLQKLECSDARGILKKPFDPVSLAADVRRIVGR